MAVGAPEKPILVSVPFDFEEREVEFHEGNGNFNGGIEDNDGGGGDGDEDDYLALGGQLGFVSGMATGLGVGITSVVKYDHVAEANFRSTHQMIAVRSTNSAVESGIHAGAVDQKLEGSLLIGPVLVLSIVGMFAGGLIGSRRSK
jgi:hypothetical protein